MSASASPERSRAFFVAGIGALSIITGSSPASTAVCTLASGVRPSSRALSEVIISMAAAPSLIWEGGLGPGHLPRVRAPPRPFVGVEHPPIRQLDRRDLAGQPALVDRGGELGV